MRLPFSRVSAIVLVASATIAGAYAGTDLTTNTSSEPATTGGPATFRRLNELQYKRSIEDIFGADIKVPGRFEPPVRDEGLLAIGDSKVVVTPSGFEQYEIRAREIASQVLANPRLNATLCSAKVTNKFDHICASDFLGRYGRLLFRRPLNDRELASVLKATRLATETSNDFNKGLEFGLSALLVSPNFVFRVETTRPNSTVSGQRHLDDYSLASRVSFFLWDAPPDAELLDAAASGQLRQEAGLTDQVDRLIRSPRFEQGVRAFFSDMYGYDQFDGLSKDQSLFLMYSSQLSKDAEEQSLRTIVDFLVAEKGDYRDLFTMKKTFINRSFGALYKVPVDYKGFDGEWMPYTFGPSDRRAGLLTLAGFLMLDPEHEGRSSPTIRGKMVRELLLCQKVPAPPGNVNFSLVQETDNPLYKTARERLTAHRDNPTCAGCHSIMDPTGLGMENYDAVGQYRTEENGAPIDASGTFEGKSFTNLIEFERILHDSPAVPNCLVKRAYEYGVGRSTVSGEQDWLKRMDQLFGNAGYAFPTLMRQIATSKAFQAISAENAPTMTAANALPK